MARRIGSGLDPMVRELDTQGRELAWNDDAPGLMGDSQLSFKAPAAGDYLVEIRDIRWQGGLYRLRSGISRSFPSPIRWRSSAGPKLR